MYPDNKNEYPLYILRDTWDEPIPDLAKKQNYLISDEWVFEKNARKEKNVKNIEFNANDILKIFYEYIQTNFNDFNHHVRLCKNYFFIMSEFPN